MVKAYYHDADRVKLMSIRSPPINIEDIGTIHFRLRRSADSKVPDLVRADIQIDASTIFISFSLASDGWPFVIENSSDFTVGFCQQVSGYYGCHIFAANAPQDAERDQAVRDKAALYHVQPHTSTSYAWDNPSARDKKILLNIGSARRLVDIMEIGDLVPFKFMVRQPSLIC